MWSNSQQQHELVENFSPAILSAPHDPVAADTHPLLSRPYTYNWEQRDAPAGRAWRNKWWGFPEQEHSLSKILQRVSLPKWTVTSKSTYSDIYGLGKVELTSTVDGTSLGSIADIDLAALRPLVVPSSFGLGQKTVYDEAVRKGLEVSANKITFSKLSRNTGGGRYDFDDPFAELAHKIQSSLFPARPVKLVFYKLAMYEPGGHFKLHRDTTHTDSHHGTLVIACGIYGPYGEHRHRGGQFLIAADGEENVLDLGAGETVAFYTDVQHAVAPVTFGTRVTLQFDIYLEDESVERSHTIACASLAESSTDRHGLYPSFHDPTYPSIVPTIPVLDVIDDFVSQLKALLLSTPGEEPSSETPRTIVFTLAHLYRQRCIRREYLKGADIALVHALDASDQLAVFMYPAHITFAAGGRTSVGICEPLADELVPLFEDPVLVLDRDCEAHNVMNGNFTLGNEAGSEFSKYYAGAVLVTRAPAPPFAPPPYERGPWIVYDSDGNYRCTDDFVDEDWSDYNDHNVSDDSKEVHTDHNEHAEQSGQGERSGHHEHSEHEGNEVVRDIVGL